MARAKPCRRRRCPCVQSRLLFLLVFLYVSIWMSLCWLLLGGKSVCVCECVRAHVHESLASKALSFSPSGARALRVVSSRSRTWPAYHSGAIALRKHARTWAFKARLQAVHRCHGSDSGSELNFRGDQAALAELDQVGFRMSAPARRTRTFVVVCSSFSLAVACHARRAPNKTSSLAPFAPTRWTGTS